MSVILAGAIDGCIHNCIIWGTILGIIFTILFGIFGFLPQPLLWLFLILAILSLPCCWCTEAVWGFWDGCYGGIINAITEICCA